MSLSIRSYRIGKKVSKALEDSLTISVEAASMLDFDDEMRLVESIRGKSPVFPDRFSDMLAPRGSVALAAGCQTLPQSIEGGLKEMDAAYAV